MSISDVRMRIDELRNEMASRAQQARGSSADFNTILQEKMGSTAQTASAGTAQTMPLEAASQTAYSGGAAQTSAGAANGSSGSYVVRSGDILVENTISGMELAPLREVQAYNYTQNAVQSYGTGGLAAGGFGGYDAQCPQCVAQAGANAYGTSGGAYGNMTATSSGLSERDLAKAAPYMQYVNEASQRYGMPVNLILGIMKAESDFNNECVSYAGAKGLMQLMPETAAEVGVTDEFDPRQNILGSVEYVTKLINKYGGDVRLALAAYNTGPGKIARRGVTSSTSAEYLTVPQSIRDYAERVLKYAGYVG